jgi:ketosteroid isomerase-like protein
VSQRDVELLRHAYEAFHARDIEALISYCAPDIEFQSTFAAVGGVYHGHDGMRRWQRDYEETFGTEVRVETEAYFDVGEHTLAFQVLHGRGSQSGAEVALPGALVARWREGRIAYMKGYTHREDALRDLGVTEDELEPIDP